MTSPMLKESKGSSPLTRGKHHASRRTRTRPRLIPAHAGKTPRGGASHCGQRAHPRSRGENTWILRRRCSRSGSSPLTRGKLVPVLHYLLLKGLIPAHAGKTRRERVPDREVKAHPRSRGENLSGLIFLFFGLGSSPLTRGKRGAIPTSQCPPRLIPAHAGKTRTRSWQTVKAAAHPRSRGENGAFGRARSCTTGSSPLTRGKPRGSVFSVIVGRLIPAHAGKTGHDAGVTRVHWAHPRSRGENSSSRAGTCWHFGSSPLTRGKPAVIAAGPDAERLIPAHAGKTMRPPCQCVGNRAHPRSRGENKVGSLEHHARAGSSPLTRGKHDREIEQQRQPGLIPAHAGKTLSVTDSYVASTAHPRSRGENTNVYRLNIGCDGSSPLTRGKPRSHR